jgi:CubicO group peptidase (beta-lactamase class C family)
MIPNQLVIPSNSFLSHRVTREPLRSRRLDTRLGWPVICLIAIAAITLPAALNAQTPTQLAQADSLFFDLTESTPGAAVVVVREGVVVFRAGYGMADLDHGVWITPQTVFDVASVSKQFGGFAVASLVESGAIDLDAEVRDYLPELPSFGASLTVRHLVHHVSGIRDWPLTLATAGWRFDDVISFDQILRMAWSQRELNFEPGTEYSYSNTGYNLLAEIVQRVTGQTFRAWTDENIFEPLGMSSSHFQDNHLEVVPRRAHGYMPTAAGEWTVSPNGLTALGSSSLHSSVDDMARWLINFDSTVVVGAPSSNGCVPPES